MTGLSYKLIGKVDETNPIYTFIKEHLAGSKLHLEICELDDVISVETHDVYIVDSKAALMDGNLKYIDFLKSIFTKDSSLLLLDLDEVYKRKLIEYIGFSSTGISDAFFISTKKNVSDKIETHIVDFKSNDDCHRSSISFNSEGEVIPEKDGPHVINDDYNKDRVESFYEKMRDVHFAKPDEDNDIPPELKYKKWIYSVNYPWNCWERPHWYNFVPRKQNTHGDMTYTVYAFLDEAVNLNKFDWIYVDVEGLWSTGGMNQNKHNERGWSIGSIDISIPDPSGFSYYKCHPTNVNDVQTVTTEMGFDVGYQQGSGVQGSYHFGSSTTKNIRDWEIKLLSRNKWLFEQNHPFKGKTTSFPDGALHWQSSQCRERIHDLPNLSKLSIDVDTKSAWKNNKHIHGVVTIKPYLSVLYNYLAVKDWSWCPGNPHDWKAIEWSEYYERTHAFDIDLGVLDKLS
ncbi:MAG TPA: hypothetical protein PLM24_04150 [Methanothrix sp.]|nr:hypothetical protein [Methanothrix sp.]HPJ83439.1 hypothetical protein [Methanothrix sp.]HPR66309.1 hypothetical protein [Methanothrix sp.]